MLEDILDRIENGCCEVIGLGKSNIPLCRWLAAHGARRIVGRDRQTPDKLGSVANELEDLGVRLVTGEGYLDGIGDHGAERTVIFRSPGIYPGLPQISDAVTRGACLSSEMELFFELAERRGVRITAITGSDGKTTTTTLTSLFLRTQFGESRRVYVGGNIGEPLLPFADGMTDRDVAVVELSSFQLMTMRRGAHRAAVTNVTPNHLNWHRDMAEYAAAKRNVFAYGPTELLVVNADNDITAGFGREFSGRTSFFSSKRDGSQGVLLSRAGDSAFFLRNGKIIAEGEISGELLDVSEILLPGRHNIENYMTAMALTADDVDPAIFSKVARSFKGVPHRLEAIGEKHGVRFFNSSIDSSPTRTAAALSAFDGKVIVICGGYDKNIPFAPLAETLCKRAKAVVLTGATSGKILDAIRSCPSYAEGKPRVFEEPDFTDAVLTAAGIAERGDTVVLSPACASFDAFRNFEERGDRFKEIVSSL